MNRILINAIVLLALSLLFPFSIYGAERNTAQEFSVKEIYELQERCGKSSAEFFKKMYGTGYEIKGMYQDYDCHYNKKLNRCFIEIISFPVGEKNNHNPDMIELWDAQEHLLLGVCTKSPEKTGCIFQGKKCNSKQEWNQLAHPFLTE